MFHGERAISDTRSRDLQQLIEAGLGEIPWPATPAQVRDLAELATHVEGWGKAINLTGHRTREEIARRLIVDAAALLPHLPESRTLTDIGSGAGFPGLPLALLLPHRTLTLIEARRRRHHFQRSAVRRLGISNATLLHGRAEALTPTAADCCIAQAVASPGVAVGLALPWLREGGWLVVPGGPRPPSLAPHPDLEEPRIILYTAPLGGPPRSLWIARRATR